MKILWQGSQHDSLRSFLYSWPNLFFLQLLVLFSPYPFCCDRHYFFQSCMLLVTKNHYCTIATQDFGTVVIFELVLRPAMVLLILFLPWYPSQSDFCSSSGCVSKTRTAPQCGALPKLVVALINLVDYIFSHKNVLIPWTTDLKNSSFALLLQMSGKGASSLEKEGSI